MEIEGMELSNNVWNRTKGNVRYSWDIPTLIQYAKEQKYKVFEIPIKGIDMSWNPFDYDNVKDFIEHVKRVEEADLKHPILIDDLGTICDGWHRVVKAVLLGKKYIKAIRIEKMLPPSKTTDL